MNKDIKVIIDVIESFGCEFEILDNLGVSIYKTNLYEEIKNKSLNLEKNIINYNNKYYEFSRKSLNINEAIYYVNKYDDVTRFQNEIMMLKEDALTTLPNRYAIELFLSNNVGTDYITVICDLDDFKKINDTYGHQQGDVVLKNFGIILKRLLSQNIFVGRYGGEEFVMFFKNTNVRYVKQHLSNIRKEIENNVELTNDKYQIKVSSGMCIMDKDKTLKNSIKEADMALYYVKNNGKNADAIYNNITNSCYIIE